jgi:hypothetical protein
VPDLRYHLISLISVFLALAIGILLGVAMADRGVVSNRVQAEITSIQQDLDRQQREIARRDEQIADSDAMLEGMSEVMISDSLKGKDVALVAGPFADREVSGAVQSALSEAGANITTFETLELPSPDEITVQDLTTQEATTQLTSGYADDFADQVLGFDSEEAELPDIIIFVGGGEIPPDAQPGTLQVLKSVQRRIFDIWLDAGTRVIGAEPTVAGRTEVSFFQDAGVPSVVNADQPAGRAAIIRCAKMEDCEGTYGTKESAAEAFPPPS